MTHGGLSPERLFCGGARPHSGTVRSIRGMRGLSQIAPGFALSVPEDGTLRADKARARFDARRAAEVGL